MYGEKVSPVTLYGMQLSLTGNYGQHVCHLNKFNTTILYEGQGGAMSTRDDGNWQSIIEAKKQNEDADRKRNAIMPAWQQAKEYRLKNMVDGIPVRPNIVMVQS